MKYKKPNLLLYRFAQFVSWIVAAVFFRRRILRNEIRGKTGPFVVVANHEAALDFVNLIGLTGRPMSFVISNSFYNTLPVKAILRELGVIPKQQFQTSAADLKRIKSVVNQGEPLVIYPAGLMCEDGLSTPIPKASYKFLKWLGVDVYAARTSGSYFVMPKWSRGLRAGRTDIDVYKLISAEELTGMTPEQVQEKVDGALLFDAYREQETMRVRYAEADNIEGLENVLYMCPCCKKEFSMRVRDRRTIYCVECGFEEESDEYAFLHKRRGRGRELRYVSDWSRMICADLKERLRAGRDSVLTAKTKIHMIDFEKNKFVEVGAGTVSLDERAFVLSGQIRGEGVELVTSIADVPTLPFKPGRYFEIQHGKEIYRCVLEDGRLTMKFINMVKMFYELRCTA